MKLERHFTEYVLGAPCTLAQPSWPLSDGKVRVTGEGADRLQEARSPQLSQALHTANSKSQGLNLHVMPLLKSVTSQLQACDIW